MHYNSDKSNQQYVTSLVHQTENGPVKHDFYPYQDNGGTCVAITGPGYVVMASDTRLSAGYQILSRNETTILQLSEKVFISMTGCRCDVLTFYRNLQAQHKMYQYEHGRPMDVRAAAQFISIQLYNKRFFPYYVSTLVAGLDENNKGMVFHYDPVGSMEELTYSTTGSSAAILQPLLDHSVGQLNVKPELKRSPLTVTEAVTIAKDCFISASERDIHCGDAIDLRIITPQGINCESVALRRD